MYVGKKILKYRSPHDYVDILPIGDLHIGNTHTDINSFKKTLKRLDEDNVYWIGMGDMIDSIIVSDSRFDYKTTNIGDVILDFADELVDMLSDYSDKCLGYLTGNHEDKLRKQIQIDVANYVAKRLGVDYLGFSALLMLIFRRNGHSESLRLFATHGSFNGRKRSGRINRIEEISEFIDADIFLMGHTHDILFTQDVVYSVNKSGNKVEKLRTYVLTGGYLCGYSDDVDYTYIESKLLKPLVVGTPVVRIYPELKKVVCLRP